METERTGETELETVLETAVHAARRAAEVHREHVGRVRVEDWSEKGVADFVTHVDREAEEEIVARVRARFPDHAILAEEGTAVRVETGAAGAEPDWLWIIDPLDGTTNFLHGYPMYAVSIGVAHHGTPVAGVVLASATGEEWTAVRGAGARLGGEPIHVSEIADLKQALIGTGFPFKATDLLPRYLRQFDRILRGTSGIRRAGSAALDLCHLATGYFDGFWELVLSPWDVAAGTLIVREAGGIVTTLDGDADVLRLGPVLAGNPAVYDALGTLLRSVE